MSGSFSEFALSEQQPNTRPVIADVNSPAEPISVTFPYQSFYDSTLLSLALQPQYKNQPIVAAQPDVQVTGYSVGLHPSSETPIAIQFKVGSQRSTSAPLILKPGQIVRPFGLPPGMKSGAFSGFRFGLPFGWLGGGNATLIVFKTPDASTFWTERTEIAFHRSRFLIKAPAAATFPSYNWPMRFPWIRATYDDGTFAASINQGGQPAIAVAQPSRILVALRATSLATAGTIRMYASGTQELGLDGTGAVVTTEGVFSEIPVPTYAALAGVGVSGFPVFEVTGPAARLGADNGKVEFVSSTAALQGLYIDICRFGYL